MYRWISLVLLTLFFGTALMLSATALQRMAPGDVRGILADPGSFSQRMGETVENGAVLPALSPEVSLRLGRRLQNGIYVVDGALIEDFLPPDEVLVEQNTAALATFGELMYGQFGNTLPCYLMLVPTDSDIRQQELPVYAYPYDQKDMINRTYSRLRALPYNFRDVSAYDVLFKANSQYIYYNTSSQLTSLGGYYLYLALNSRIGFTDRAWDLSAFEVNHVSGRYLGPLYSRTYARGVEPDIVSIYAFTGAEREYRVVHHTGSGIKYYDTLFPEHAVDLGAPTDIVLGGLSPRVDVVSASPYTESLLIITDETVSAYLSFVAVHYQQITVLNINELTEAIVADIDIIDYQRVLVSLSLDSLAHSDKPAAALGMLSDRLAEG